MTRPGSGKLKAASRPTLKNPLRASTMPLLEWVGFPILGHGAAGAAEKHLPRVTVPVAACRISGSRNGFRPT